MIDWTIRPHPSEEAEAMANYENKYLIFAIQPSLIFGTLDGETAMYNDCTLLAGFTLIFAKKTCATFLVTAYSELLPSRSSITKRIKEFALCSPQFQTSKSFGYKMTSTTKASNVSDFLTRSLLTLIW